MDSFTIYQAFLTGKKQFKMNTLYKVLTQVVAFTAMFCTLLLSSNLLIILITYFVSWTLMRCIFLFITLKQHVDNNIIDPDAIVYGKHLTLMKISGTISTQIDKILLFHFLGPTFKDKRV